MVLYPNRSKCCKIYARLLLEEPVAARDSTALDIAVEKTCKLRQASALRLVVETKGSL